MINFFEHLKNLLYKKNTKVEIDSELQPYLLNRYMSMYSRDMCVYINETLNKYNIDDKHLWYKVANSIIPRVNYKRIEYIKKEKKDKKPQEKEDNLALMLEISQREIKIYKDIIEKGEK